MTSSGNSPSMVDLVGLLGDQKWWWDAECRRQREQLPERAESKHLIRAPRWARTDLLVKDAAFHLGLEIDVERDTTLFRETVRYRARGPRKDVMRFDTAVAEAMRRYNDGGETR